MKLIAIPEMARINLQPRATIDIRGSQTQMPESAASSDAMQISFCHFGEVEVEDDVYCRDVDSPREQIRAYQISAIAD